MRLVGELDLAEVGPLQAEFERLCPNGLSALTVDLSGLDFLDSTGLHALLTPPRTLRGPAARPAELVPGPPRSSGCSGSPAPTTQFTFAQTRGERAP